MKNFKRSKPSTEGQHGYTYTENKDDLKFVPCCSEGWILFSDLEPDPEYFGPVQIVQVHNSKKTRDNVKVIYPQLAHIEGPLKFHFYGNNWDSEKWQPMANLPRG